MDVIHAPHDDDDLYLCGQSRADGGGGMSYPGDITCPECRTALMREWGMSQAMPVAQVTCAGSRERFVVVALRGDGVVFAWASGECHWQQLPAIPGTVPWTAP